MPTDKYEPLTRGALDDALAATRDSLRLVAERVRATFGGARDE